MSRYDFTTEMRDGLAGRTDGLAGQVGLKLHDDGRVEIVCMPGPQTGATISRDDARTIAHLILNEV